MLSTSPGLRSCCAGAFIAVGVIAAAILFTCVSPGVTRSDELGHALKQNERGLALVVIERGTARVIPFDGSEFRRCATAEMVVPVVATDGRSTTWLSGKQIVTHTLGGRVFIQALAGTAARRVEWMAVVPNHPDAIAYATRGKQPLDQTVIFDASPKTAIKLDWPRAHFEREQTALFTAPAWSPNGKELVFNNSSRVVYLWNIVSGETKRMGPGVNPSWSPDGQWIAYWTNHGPEKPFEAEAWLADVKTGITRKLFAFDNLDSSFPLRWSPDGRYLLFGKIVRGTMAPNSEDLFSVYRLQDGASQSIVQLPRENIVSRGPYWIVGYGDLERAPNPVFGVCRGK